MYYMKPSFNPKLFSTYAHAQDAFKEIEITFAADIKDGEMRELVIGDGEEDKVLIARYKGEL